MPDFTDIDRGATWIDRHHRRKTHQIQFKIRSDKEPYVPYEARSGLPDFSSPPLRLETPLYQYQPLEHSDSIRILIIHPSPRRSRRLTCTIRHARLFPYFPEYEAVSYTWGKSTKTRTVHINNGKLRILVGKNCHDALCRLRLPQEYRSVWIDAVCINQDDLQERAHQVRMMNEVYDRAWGILVMLSNQVSDNHFLLDRLAHVSNLLDLGIEIRRSIPTTHITRQLQVLFEDPWFRRTWVLQEVYAKDSVTVMYGTESIPFETLRTLYFGYREVVARAFWPVHLEFLYKTATEYTTVQFTLWNRLYESRSCLASNPRDKVFALKSLLGPEQSKIDHLIDYTQSVELCFIAVAKFLLPVLGLRILTATRHPHELLTSSWIPDWSQTSPLQHFAFSFEESLVSEAKGWYEFEWNSSGKSVAGPVLHVEGNQHSHIVESSKTFEFVNMDDAKDQMYRLYQGIDPIKPYLDKGSKLDISTASHYFGGKVLDAISPMDARILHRCLTRSRERTDYRTSVGDYDRDTATIFLHTKIGDFYEALQHCQISLMQNGELAIVPRTAKTGDVVCIISGAISPCVLRRNMDSSWHVVSGDCYLFDTSPQIKPGLNAYGRLGQEQVEEFTVR